MNRLFRCGCVILGLLPFITQAASAQSQNGMLLMKDGFVLRGKVVQPRDFLVDPASGRSFSIPQGGANYFVDDGVRRILFSPRQVQEVIDEKDRVSPTMLTKLSRLSIGDSYLPDWRVESFGEFNDRWERNVRINSPRGPMDITQRITVMTPKNMRVDSLRIDWIPRYFTNELEPRKLHDLLKWYFQKQEIKELEKQRKIFNFLVQAGFHDFAGDELEKFFQQFPDQKSNFADIANDIKRVQALTFFEHLNQAYKSGQHKEVQRRIEHMQNTGMTKLLGQELLRLQEIKNELATLKEKMDLATMSLKALPTYVNALNRELFTEAANAIAEELSHEGLPRLDLFTAFAEQFAREVKEGKTPSQSADKVLALAISGWLQGSNAASPDVPTAASLWQARKMIINYLNSTDATERSAMAAVFAQQHKLPIDVIGRMMTMLPPVNPHKADGLGLPFDLTAEGGKGQYTVQLPPEYNNNRTYPVLLLLHSSSERPADMLAKFRELGGRHGYILAAPSWGGGLQAKYNYSEAEHEAVLSSLRDLRRRFNVDTDRVFLFGFEEGANAAFDIGLSHPHEFAAVLPMSGDPSKLPSAYWPNAQYLPFYVVDGGFSDSSTKANNELFKKWIRYGYPSLYFEYKGRMADWFVSELPNMFDWMGRKKRSNPSVQLGTFHTGGGQGEEFCTARTGDDRFYWIGTSAIAPNRLFDSRVKTAPATLQARISMGNELIKLKDGATANIWNQIAIRTSGVGNVVVWFGPNMIDFTKPTVFRINSQQYGRPQDIQPKLETMLEEVYRSGDRQRLWFARVEVRLQ